MSEATETPKTSADQDRATHLEEWKIARESMQFFDDKLHDLRKYGFSLVTALLATEGIVIGKLSPDVDASVKFAVFGVTLLLILAVHLIDQNYRVSQQVINMRAVILERKLNLEMSETITDRYKAGDINSRVLGLYLVFIGGALWLGCLSLYPNWIYIAILIAVFVVATILTYILRPHTKFEKYREDWTISPLECTPKDKVTITLTNLSELFKRGKIEPIVFGKIGEVEEDPLIWTMINEETDEPTKKMVEGGMAVHDSHTWTLTIDDFLKNGTYQLKPRGWSSPLHRRIVVSGKVEKTD